MTISEQALFDECECGDYRHQHKGKNHDGACELGSLCWPGHCKRFRFAFAAKPDDPNLQRALRQHLKDTDNAPG